MKPNREFLAVFGLGLALVCGARAATALPAEWRHVQQFTVSSVDLVKLSLPPATLDAARPALEDVRLYDDAGSEMPFFIARPTPAGVAVQTAKSFRVTMADATTVITLETGLTQPVNGVTLETPATGFIKGVRVEGSADGRTWQRLADGQPVFHQTYRVSQLHVAFPDGTWRWLRLTVDDRRSAPIPFTSARVHAAAAAPVPAESQPVKVLERNENPGETRLTLDLSGANLDVASVTIETDEPLFTRDVTLAVPHVTEETIREQVVGRGVIYRVALEGQPVSDNLVVPLEALVRSRELVLLIRNEDSPPLSVKSVRVERRPVYLIFMPRHAGNFHLLTGNPACSAPRYDLAGLGATLKGAALTDVAISTLTDNPAFRAPEALRGVEVGGAVLDVSAWQFRKPVQLARGGAEQLELDLDVLAHADAGLADLRVVRGGAQVPYILHSTSISRSLTPAVTVTNDARNPKLSRWIIKLSRPGLPLTYLACVTKSTLFQREMALSEEVADERGNKYRRALGSATWTQTPDRKSGRFSLSLTAKPQSETLFLETENGDNPAIVLEGFTVSYSVTRVLFKAAADDRPFLYYGNPRVSSPKYDLSLVAGELLAAEKATASLGGEDQLKKSLWSGTGAPNTGGVVFWAVLALVVVGLLVVISRLLPKASAPN